MDQTVIERVHHEGRPLGETRDREPESVGVLAAGCEVHRQLRGGSGIEAHIGGVDDLVDRQSVDVPAREGREGARGALGQRDVADRRVLIEQACTVAGRRLARWGSKKSHSDSTSSTAHEWVAGCAGTPEVVPVTTDVWTTPASEAMNC